MDRLGRSLFRNGERVPIQEQPYQLLLALLEAPGQVVTREDLRLRLWGEETYVDFDQSLNSAVRRLRVALGDSPRQPVYVATVPRVGFRFLAEVREGEPFVASSLSRSVAGEEKTLELDTEPILPSVRAGSGSWPVHPHLLLFGAAALLAAILASTGGTRVWAALHAGRNGWTGTAQLPPDAGGSDSELTSPLLSLPSGERSAPVPGSQQVGPDLAGLPVSQTINPGLGGTGGEMPSARGVGTAVQLEASGTGAFLELTGWYHLGLRTQADNGLAKAAFERAIADDQRAPTPLVGLAESEILSALNGYTPAERLQTARRAAGQALQLEPHLADAHAVLGAVDALTDWDLTAAEREFHMALELDPHSSLARMWYAVFALVPQHRYAEAEQHTRWAIHDAPLSLTAHTNLGWILANQGRAAAARQQYQFVLNLNPNFVPARFHMAQLLRTEGRTDEAQRMLPVDPPDREQVLLAGGILPRATSLVAKPPAAPCEQIPMDREDAMFALRAAVQRRCPTFLFFGQDPTFNDLHRDPEFATLEQAVFLARPK